MQELSLERGSEYSLIRHLCSGVLLNHDPERTWIAIVTEYQVYLDDSGHPDGQPYVVVAGFLSTEPKWVAFDLAWKAALQRNGLPDVFHMTDFEATIKDKKKKGIILEDLTTTINNHVVAALSCSVDMTAYKKVNGTHCVEEWLGKPFAMAARAVARGINTWKRNFFREGDHLLVFIEEGTKHRGDMEETFRRDDLPIPQMVPKKHPSVQAADILAWESFYYLRHEDTRRRSMVNLLRNKFPCDDLEGVFHEHNLLKTCEQAKVPLRASVPPNVGFVYHSTPKRVRKRTIK